MLDKYVIRSNSTAYRIIDGVALVVSGADGQLRTLNKIGTFIWELSDGRYTLEDIIGKICEKFDVDYLQASRDAEAFARELQHKKMLILSDMATG